MNKIIPYITITILLSCCHTSPKNEIKKVILEWQGKQIVIPSVVNFKISGRDTLCADLWNKPYKILTYVDSVGCTSCQLGLDQWIQLIDSSKNDFPDIGFLFVVHSSDYKQFNYELLLNEFHYPIIYDTHNEFDKLNHFPKEPYRSFLLDKDNKVILIGSPIKNQEIWKLYQKTMSQQ